MIPGPIYQGKLTCCHTQALLTATAPSARPADVWLFEALTTVPFGVVSRAGDPNRLLTCVADPDLGLDRALELLGVRFEVRSWPDHAGADEPLVVLRDWLASGPVVVGPLDMGKLSHLYQQQLYAGFDHFLVVRALGPEGMLACDPEGYMPVLLSPQSLVDAWRAEGVPERRGAFVLRRTLAAVDPHWHDGMWPALLRHIVSNHDAAERQPRGGPAAYAALEQESACLEADPTMRRGLTFALPTRIQRCLCQKLLLERVVRHAETRAVEEAVLVLDEQIRVLGRCVAGLLEGRRGRLGALGRLAFLERRLAAVYLRMKGNR